MIAIVDNYDSFTYNLFQLIGTVEPDIKVVRNDEVRADDLRALAPSHLVISPGPGRPADAGNCIPIIREMQGELPILGVCLGHQAICEAYGATVTYASRLMHGKQSLVNAASGSRLFEGMGAKFPVARYHSLAADPATMPACLKVVAATDDGEVMAIEHADFPTFGLQFHPESILTPGGMQIIRNFLAIR